MLLSLLFYGYATGTFSSRKLEAQFKQEIDDLMKLVKEADNVSLPEDMDVPEEPQAKDQVNLTDEESRIMLTKSGFEQAYNAQVETVFGIIKHIQGFRQFHHRGLDLVKSEWNLVSIGWNLKRMHALRG
jgi:hypothetical protein